VRMLLMIEEQASWIDSLAELGLEGASCVVTY